MSSYSTCPECGADRLYTNADGSQICDRCDYMKRRPGPWTHAELEDFLESIQHLGPEERSDEMDKAGVTHRDLSDLVMHQMERAKMRVLIHLAVGVTVIAAVIGLVVATR